MFRPIAAFLFKILGWKVIDHRPPGLRQCIYVVAPHTSSWDFPLGLMARSYGRLENARYMAKAELFKPPFGWIFKVTGGVAVDRGKSAHIVDQMAAHFRSDPDFAIGMAPEGTRKFVAKWKTGFWHIARKAEVPLILTSFDYGRKEVTFREPYMVGDDVEKEMAWIQEYFMQFKGKNERPTAP